QVGRLVREGAVDGIEAEAVLAVGESQSAAFLTTYVNEVDPSAGAYDGFLVHSRFGAAAPLDGASIFGGNAEPEVVPFRPDLRVPVLTVITETDLIGGFRAGYYRARQPDDDKLRVWEIPGTAHADTYTIRGGFIDSGRASIEELASVYAPTKELMGQRLSYSINFAPQHHYVLQAAIAHVDGWVRTGTPAPAAEPMALTDGDPPALDLDANGLARGGVRTPWVDVPIARTSGLAPTETLMSFLFGSGEVFDIETLRSLYPGGPADYLERFTAAL
ncbi:hypothetical protein LV457_19975, partial [Mycobacterium sp. MYCO198283]|uniref:alpha/beta hydrolase domain-containing protein n=1 Tax=Mycobacterium sp. MYCO198283 TaxID=2883505 RepID=UPI002105825E